MQFVPVFPFKKRDSAGAPLHGIEMTDVVNGVIEGTSPEGTSPRGPLQG